MSVPDSSLFGWLYAILNSPPIGGVAVLAVGTCSVIAYGLGIRWIARGAQASEPEAYAYPTAALLDED